MSRMREGDKMAFASSTAVCDRRRISMRLLTTYDFALATPPSSVAFRSQPWLLLGLRSIAVSCASRPVKATKLFAPPKTGEQKDEKVSGRGVPRRATFGFGLCSDDAPT